MRPYPLNISTLLLIGLLVVGFRPALISWVTVNETVGRCRFSFPAGYALNRLPEVAMYTVSAENITFEMHFINTEYTTAQARLVPGTRVTTVAPADRYAKFADAMVQAINGQLVAQRNVVQNNREGREIEVTYNAENTDDPSRMITQFYWLDSGMYAFTVSAPASAGQQGLNNAKNIMANSIQFY